MQSIPVGATVEVIRTDEVPIRLAMQQYSLAPVIGFSQGQVATARPAR
jgi:hypothetical protein